MTVQQDFELRKTVRGAGGNYSVVKNNIAAKASARICPRAMLLNGLKGMTSMAWTTRRSSRSGKSADRLTPKRIRHLHSSPASSRAAPWT